jgi:hypothetical protein
MTREGELYIAQWKHMTEATGRKLADISRARQPATTQRMTAIRYDPATSTGLCMYNDDAPSMNYKTRTKIDTRSTVKLGRFFHTSSMQRISGPTWKIMFTN